MNARITRRLRAVVQLTMPDLTEAQQRSAHRGMKRRWNQLPRNDRYTVITQLERAASAVVSQPAVPSSENVADSHLTEPAKE